MRKFFVFALAVCLLAPMGMAQVNEVGPATGPTVTAAPSGDRGFGDLLDVVLNLEGNLGDLRTLGVEFDGTNYWVTSAFDFTIAYIYEIAPDGTVLNTYPQPAAHWATWGWRDLAYDGNYMYAGTDADHPGEISQIDMTNGTQTGVFYGPIPETVTRALAYDPKGDTFFCANWGGEIYRVKRGINVTSYSMSTNLSCYGMAIDERDPSHPMLWLWSQDGTNLLTATEFDYDKPMAPPGSFTGVSFQGPAEHGVMAGGAAAIKGPDGWELIGMAQTPGPDGDVAHYQLWADSLEADATEVDTNLGGTVNFMLNAGSAHAGEDYALVGSISGSIPGWTLPGGLVLPLNYDQVTTWTIQLGLSGSPITPGFFGTLDGSGMAAAQLNVPGHLGLTSDADLTLAFCTIQPYTFVSNEVVVTLLAPVPPPPGYSNDDGTAEGAVMWSGAQHNCWMTHYDSGSGDTIDSVSIAWGYQGGTSAIDGFYAELYVYEDPNEDGSPTDAVLLGTIVTTIQQAHTNTFIKEMLGSSVAVVGKFLIAAYTFADSGTADFPSGYDSSDPASYYANEGWLCGAGATWDPTNPTADNALEMGGIGYTYHWMLRGNQ